MNFIQVEAEIWGLEYYTKNLKKATFASHGCGQWIYFYYHKWSHFYLEANVQWFYLHDLRGIFRSSPRLRILRGSQQKTNRATVASNKWLLLMFRFSSWIRLNSYIESQCKNVTNFYLSLDFPLLRWDPICDWSVTIIFT